MLLEVVREVAHLAKGHEIRIGAMARDPVQVGGLQDDLDHLHVAAAREPQPEGRLDVPELAHALGILFDEPAAAIARAPGAVPSAALLAAPTGPFLHRFGDRLPVGRIALREQARHDTG
jgi:hypothetical protein